MSPLNPMGLLCIALLASVGCGSASAARTSLVMSAHVVNTIDQVGAETASDTRDDHGDQAQAEFPEDPRAARARFFQLRAPFEQLKDVVDGMRETLFAAEAFVDAEGSDGFGPIAACIARGLTRLANVAETAGLELPSEVNAARSLLTSFGGSCNVQQGAVQ